MSEQQATRDSPPPPGWPTCAVEECIGIQLDGQDTCLAHVDEEARKSYLAGLYPEASVDLRGTLISATLLSKILTATSTAEGVVALAEVKFARAQFTGDARFDQAHFTGAARFDGARFTGAARFDGTRFTGAARFDGTRFTGDAGFDQAQFTRNVVFAQAHFTGDAGFDQAQFTGSAGFEGARFTGDAWFEGAQFSGDAWFEGAQFSESAGFGAVQFTRDASFARAQFTGDASFGRTQFTRNAWFTEVRFTGDGWFNRAQFTRSARFDGARFLGAARFEQARLTGAGFDQTQFTGNAWFTEARFTRDASFGAAQFTGDASFGGAQFSGVARFTETKFAEDAWFDGAQFSGVARFTQTQFAGEARFDGAQFSETPRFTETQFAGEARFIGAQFTGEARFEQAQFTGEARFEQAQFSKTTRFTETQFAGEVWFTETQFAGEARFEQAQFSETTRFTETQFSKNAYFGRAQFTGTTWFDGTRFSGAARFDRARFDQAQQLGPILVAGLLQLDYAVFTKRVEIAAIARVISCTRTQFTGGAALEVGFAAIALDDTQFLAPSRLVAAASHGFSQEELRQVADPDRPGGPFHPRLLSLRGTDVTNLWLSNVDLGMCAFTGAQNLQTLRAEIAGIPTPRGWHGGWAWLPVWRWTRRNALVEEHAWRATTRKGHGWTLPAHLAGPDAPAASPDPKQFATVYRALREGREVSKDEPGAADFYYGEMEMRRKAPATPWSERFILWWYWLLAGYGLRGLRALAWLATVIVVLGVAFWQFGFGRVHPPLDATLVYTALATVSLEAKAPPLDDSLTLVGDVLRLVLRLSGPVLLGLALLSIRNRVKR